MPSYLIHYGIPGQKWGDRRYQNEDGTLTPAGRERYLKGGYGQSQRKALLKNNYNQYTRYNKKFDKLTEKMMRKKEAGKTISERERNRAIKYGTKARKASAYSKNLDKWLNREATANTNSQLAALPFAISNAHYGLKAINAAANDDDQAWVKNTAGQIGSLATGLILSNAAYNITLTSKSDYKKYKAWGDSIVEKSKNETIADLKKKGLM